MKKIDLCDKIILMVKETETGNHQKPQETILTPTEEQLSFKLAEKREKELEKRFVIAITGGVVPTTAGTVIMEKGGEENGRK